MYLRGFYNSLFRTYEIKDVLLRIGFHNNSIHV